MQLVMIPIRIRCAHWGELTEDERSELRDNLIIDGHVAAEDCEPIRASMSEQGRVVSVDIRHPDLGDGSILLLHDPDTRNVVAILISMRNGYHQQYIVGGWLELSISTLVEFGDGR